MPPFTPGSMILQKKKSNYFLTSRLKKTCANCLDASVIIVDNHTGDQLCSSCGLVLESKILSEEQEWRSFSNSEGNTQYKSRIGGPNDVWLESSVQTTSMIGGAKKHSKLIQTHEMTTATQGSDKLILTAFNNLKNIADFFDLRDNIIERCKEIVKDLQVTDQLKFRTGEVYMLSVTYLACREEQIPKTLRDLVMFNPVITEKELGRAINRLRKLISNRNQPIPVLPVDLAPGICQALQLSNDIITTVEHVVKQAELYISRGYRPNSIVAGSIYLVTQICGLDIDPSDIAAVAKTGSSTVVLIYREMLPLSFQLLPPNFNIPQ